MVDRMDLDDSVRGKLAVVEAVIDGQVNGWNGREDLHAEVRGSIEPEILDFLIQDLPGQYQARTSGVGVYELTRNEAGFEPLGWVFQFRPLASAGVEELAEEAYS